MIDINRIFSIQNDDEFERLALEIFQFQAEHCAPYKEYLNLIEVEARNIKKVSEIPFLPISLFKSHKILCDKEYEHIFRSSGTTASIQSQHYVKSLELYRRSFIDSFTKFCFDPKEAEIFALLPGYLEREDSSLIYMIKELIECGSGGGFYLYDYDKLKRDIAARDKSKRLLLFGVSFALLDLVEQGGIKLEEGDIVMETGGMKNRRRHIPRPELHRIYKEGFNVKHIASEYGMCECLSQAYSFGDGIFNSPPWLKIVLRESQNPFAMAKKRGAVNIIDLANIYSCSFIQSDDIATLLPGGAFTIDGRLSGSDIRGCNLLLE